MVSLAATATGLAIATTSSGATATRLVRATTCFVVP
jgi:hypothetical protein